MAGEFDFAPLSDEELADIANVQDEWGYITLEGVQAMARELRAWRAAGRELVEGNDQPTPAGRLKWEQAAAKLRAIVAHVDDPDEGLVHDPESCGRCRRDETLIAIDAALAEGQDG